MRKLLLCLLFTVSSFAVSGYAGEKDVRYTVIVSLDGFRYDYAEIYRTPFFDKMATEGVKAKIMPSFPSVTYPNHYTLATGLYPDHHGIVGNSFWDVKKNRQFANKSKDEIRTDPEYYGGEPIWITAQKQGLKTAAFYWVGSDVAHEGVYPTYYKILSQPRLPFGEQVDQILGMLKKPEKDRPRLIMAYFSQPDHDGHLYGPLNKKTKGEVEEMDSLVGRLWDGIQSLSIGRNVNLIVTTDHGMTAIGPDRVVRPDKYLKSAWYYRTEGSVPVMIYANKNCADSIVAALKDVPHIRTWKRNEIPTYLHFGTNARIGDVVVLPDLGWLFKDGGKATGGTHGYDPTYNDMQGIFRAMGPDFKAGYIRETAFSNVDVYSLLAYLLGIKPAKTDGNIEEIKDMINK